jgi:hypothetical protein
MDTKQAPFNTRYLAGGIPVQQVFTSATVTQFSSVSSQHAIQLAVLQSLGPLDGQMTPYVNITGVITVSSGASIGAAGAISSIQVSYILQIQAKSYSALVSYAQNISTALETSVTNGNFNKYFAKSCSDMSTCPMAGASSLFVNVSPLDIYYIPKGMSVNIPTSQPTNSLGSSQTGGASATGGSSSIAT